MKHHIFRQTSRRILKHEQLQKPTSCKPTVNVKYLYPSFAAGTRRWSQRSSDPRKWGLCFWTINNCAKKSRHEDAVKWWGTELDEGKIITWTPDFNVNITVSCKNSLKPTQWRAQKSSIFGVCGEVLADNIRWTTALLLQLEHKLAFCSPKFAEPSPIINHLDPFGGSCHGHAQFHGV